MEDTPWIVLKFGGTSIAGLPQWQRIAEQCRMQQAQGYRLTLVCSATAGVTDLLEAYISEAAEPSLPEIRDQIVQRNRELAESLGVPFEPVCEYLRRQLAVLENDRHTPPVQARILALGEWASTRLGVAYLASQGLDCGWRDSGELLLADAEQHPKRAWLEAQCSETASPGQVADWVAGAELLICQGFVARNRQGDTVVLGRGGSDTSAAYLGTALGAERVVIYTDVAGVLSGDPRYLPDAQLLRRLSYTEALEMSGAGAAVVHPRCIRVAAAANLNLEIRNLGGGEGTLIWHDQPGMRKGLKAVTIRIGMVAILLENQDIRRSVGFLAWVFSEFAQRGVSIDQVATSETTTTVVLDAVFNRLNSHELERLAANLQQRCRVSVFQSCAAVSLVGRSVRTLLPDIGSALTGLRRHPMYLASYSANDLAYSMVVPEENAIDLARQLHRIVLADRASGQSMAC